MPAQDQGNSLNSMIKGGKGKGKGLGKSKGKDSKLETGVATTQCYVQAGLQEIGGTDGEGEETSAQGQDVTLAVRNLSGEVVWGPEPVNNSLLADVVRKRVASTLGLNLWQVSLLLADSVILGQRSLASLGIIDPWPPTDLRIVIQQDFDYEVIKRIQGSMGVVLPGLTDEEISKVEAKFNFRFPPELEAFLRVGVPSGWHNWHELIRDDVIVGSNADSVGQVIAWHATPEEEDVPYDAWAGPDDTIEEIRKRACQHPLVPIRGHRMLPSVPYECGLPVLSMHQCSDNIIYGNNFWDWLEKDNQVPFGTVPEEWKERALLPAEELPFWKDWLS